MADGTTRWQKEELTAFLATFPTKLHCSETRFFPHIWVFWSQSERPQINPSWGVSDPWVIHEKIKSAFFNLYSSRINGLIQFWAPVDSGRRLLLSTSNQPFVLENLGPCFVKYRLCCQMYGYSIDDVSKVEIEDPMIISGAPTSAFLNHLPEVVNLRVKYGSPLVHSALECELTTSLVLPVFDPVSQSSNCVGVVEYCMKEAHLVQSLNDLKRALEMVGLSMFPEKIWRPYKAIPRLKLTRYEIEEALEIVCESLDLTLAQVWIAYENENHVPFSSCVEDTTRRQKFAVKLITYYAYSDDYIKEYCDSCDVFPLKIGEGLVGKTLQTHEPHFCKNINELKDNGLLGLLPTSSECSCLVICLRSIDTGDVDYTFEFLWPQRRDHFILLESVLLLLKTCLPSFKLASGAKFGDELCVLDVGNSTRSTGFKIFKILHGNGLSQQISTNITPRRHQTTIWKNHEKSRLVSEECISSSEAKCKSALIPSPPEGIEGIKQQFGRTLSEVAWNSLEWQGPNFVNRELSDLCKSEIDSNQEDCLANQEHSVSINSLGCRGNDYLIIKAEYEDHQTLIYLPKSSKIADIKKNIDEKYKLTPGSYKLQFLDFQDEWMMLDDEGDWKSCIICWSTPCFRTIRVRVASI